MNYRGSNIETSAASHADKRSRRNIRPTACTVCTHPDRVRIEALRVGGASLDALASEFGASRHAIHRHCRNHLSAKRKAELMAGPARVTELANAAAGESKSLLDYLSITRSVLFSQFVNAAEAGDHDGVVSVAGRLLDSLRELGKVTGELRQLSGITINNSLTLVTSPEFLSLQEGLLKIARAHPGARCDIVALLRGLETDEAAQSATLPPLIEGEAVHAV